MRVRKKTQAKPRQTIREEHFKTNHRDQTNEPNQKTKLALKCAKFSLEYPRLRSIAQILHLKRRIKIIFRGDGNQEAVTLIQIFSQILSNKCLHKHNLIQYPKNNLTYSQAQVALTKHCQNPKVQWLQEINPLMEVKAQMIKPNGHHPRLKW